MVKFNYNINGNGNGNNMQYDDLMDIDDLDAMDLEYLDQMDIDGDPDAMDLVYQDEMDIDEEYPYRYDPMQGVEYLGPTFGVGFRPQPQQQVKRQRRQSRKNLERHAEVKHGDNVCGKVTTSVKSTFGKFSCNNMQSDTQLCNNYGKAIRCHDIRKSGRLQELAPNDEGHKFAEDYSGSIALQCANIINKRRTRGRANTRDKNMSIVLADNICKTKKIDALGNDITPQYTRDQLQQLVKQVGGHVTQNGRYKTKKQLQNDLRRLY
jgi:hypothetical protein